MLYQLTNYDFSKVNHCVILYEIRLEIKLHVMCEYCYVWFRLVIFSAIVQLQYSSQITTLKYEKQNKIDWNAVSRLRDIPDWAVDKHTYRGRTGHPSQNLLKEHPRGMDEEDIQHFHGHREKRDLKYFFDVCAVIENASILDNPYWEQTKAIYGRYPPGKQKTEEMTHEYVRQLHLSCPQIFLQKSDLLKSNPENTTPVFSGKSAIVQLQSTLYLICISHKFVSEWYDLQGNDLHKDML